jgi:putative phosphoribosyl transferase
MKKSVVIALPEASLHGDLTLPAQGEGLVIFAHGSGSSRHSPRNRFVAEQLNTAGLGTLLMDLLTQDEERVDDVTRELRFDIGLLARRVAQVVRWAKNQTELAEAKIGLNEEAKAQMVCPTELVIVPRATHLFEEAGTLEQVAELASAWFVRYLSAAK